MNLPASSRRRPSERRMVYLSPARFKAALDERDLSNREFTARYTDLLAEVAAEYPRARALDEQAVSTFLRATPGTPKARASTQTIALLARTLGLAEDYFLDATHNKSAPTPGPAPRLLDQPASGSDERHNIGDVRPLGPQSDQPSVELPFVPVSARAGFLAAVGRASTPSFHETRRVYLRGTPAAMYAKRVVFEVNGDSMEPYINSGDEVVCVEVPEGRWDTSQNGIFVVSYTEPNGEGVVTIKKIIANDLFKRGELTLWPWRPDLAPAVVNRRQLLCLYRVEEVLPKPFKARL